ncbi:hypothetical protein Trydic_g463 [Trypoxylus dichotomus]
MAKNCWRRLTPMESGICLALIVTCCFLAIMCVVYLMKEIAGSKYFEPAYFECHKACRCLEEFSRLLFFPLNPDFHPPPTREPKGTCMKLK